MTRHVITANALVEGDVVYLAEQGAWVRDLALAQIFTADAAEAALQQAKARHGEIVGAYLVAVNVTEGTPAPTTFREVFRQRGPSNRFHGKQAEM